MILVAIKKGCQILIYLKKRSTSLARINYKFYRADNFLGELGSLLNNLPINLCIQRNYSFDNY